MLLLHVCKTGGMCSRNGPTKIRKMSNCVGIMRVVATLYVCLFSFFFFDGVSSF